MGYKIATRRFVKSLWIIAGAKAQIMQKYYFMDTRVCSAGVC